MPRKRLIKPKELKRKLQKLSKYIKFLNKKGYLPIFLGLFLIFVSLVWRHYRIRILSFNGYRSEVGQGTLRPPAVYISIPKVGLELPIFEGTIKDGVWETTDEGVVHLNESADPGGSGNIVIYGHNKNLLFGPIRWLNEGDEVELKDIEGKSYKYKITDIVETTAEDIQYVLPKDEEVLTLYTCTGFLDSKRHIIIAEPHDDQ